MKTLRNLIKLIFVATLIFSLVGFAPNPGITREAHPPIHLKPGSTTTTPTGYGPTQIRTAYGLSQLSATGAGQTIAIVDAYGSPTIQNDLAYFCTKFGIPLTKGTLTVAYPAGVPKIDAGWALETSLDVEWAHAIAPGANILLVVAKSASMSDLLVAIDYATSHGAQVVSNSWGGSEFSTEANYESHFTKSGVVYVASSGDSGAGAEWPAASPNVLSVGGTTLTNPTNSNRGETGWSGSGGGSSVYMTRPSYQSNWSTIVGLKRGVPDVAFDADPNTGVAVYDSTKYNTQSGWFEVGGTSFSAPAWAAMIVLADQGRATKLSSFEAITDLYSFAATTGSASYTNNYHDIIQGSNGYPAQAGYDLVTGIGSPKDNSLIPNLTLK